MASLTIRKLDEAIKVYLRLRSAKNGRSVEEEVRVILGELIQGRAELPAALPHAVPPATARPTRVPDRAGAIVQARQAGADHEPVAGARPGQMRQPVFQHRAADSLAPVSATAASWVSSSVRRG